jgi:hypothetical protein
MPATICPYRGTLHEAVIKTRRPSICTGEIKMKQTSLPKRGLMLLLGLVMTVTTLPRAARAAQPTIVSMLPNQMVAGTTQVITVTGTDFQDSPNATEVRLNGNQIPVTFVSATEITFTVDSSYNNAELDVSVVISNPNESGAAATGTIDIKAAAPATIKIEPLGATLTALASTVFTATVVDAFDNAISPIPGITWATSSAGTLAPPPSGNTATFKANATPGIFPSAISASLSSTPTIAANATVTVTTGPPSYLQIDQGSSITVSIGSATPFSAKVRDAAGNELTGYTLTWSTGNPISCPHSNGPTINATSGLFNAGLTPDTSCSVRVQLASPALFTNTTVTIRPFTMSVSPPSAQLQAGQQQLFSANVSDATGPLLGLPVTWAAVTGTVGTVDTTGLYTAPITTGPTGVRASLGSRNAFAPITVVPGPIARVDVTPQNITLIRNSLQQFSAQAFDALNNPVPTTFTWLADPAAGSISATGLFTATGVDSSTPYVNAVTATPVLSPTASGGATVTIQLGAVSRLELIPAATYLAIGQSRAFVVRAYDTNDNSITVPVIWSARADAGVIDQNGVFTATGASGPYSNAVIVSYNGPNGVISTTAQVDILIGNPSSIAITPSSSPVNMTIMSTRLFTAVVRNGAGQPIVNASVNWSSNAGQIESSGPLTALLRASTVARNDGITATIGTVNSVRAVKVLRPVVSLATSIGSGIFDADGVSTVNVTVTVGSEAPNTAPPEGTLIGLSATAEDGACSIVPAQVATNAAGQGFAVLSCVNSTLDESDISTVDVVAELVVLPTTQDSETLRHRSRPLRQRLPLLALPEPPVSGNNRACNAYKLSTGKIVQQAPDNEYNLYRFTASGTSVTVRLNGYASTGEIQLFAISADQCPTQLRLGNAQVAQSRQGDNTVIFNGLTANTQYLLSIRTTGARSSQLYQLSVSF